MSGSLKNNKFLWLILILAAAVRFYHLAAISLWHDEAFSALLIRYSWHEMFYRIGLDVHPPLYYIVLRVWYYIFGWSLFSLRAFSAVFGVLTVYAMYLFMQAAFNRRNLSLAAALLIAINPFQTQYVTEARMYTFGTFLLVISAYFLVQALKSDKWKYWILFAITTAASLYTHYYLFFSAFALWLFALITLIRRHRANFKGYAKFITAYILVFLGYIPWLKTFWFQFHQVQESYWITAPTKWSVPVTNWLMLTGGSADSNKHSTDVILVLACLFTLYLLYRIVRREASEYKWLVLSAVVVPFLGSLALSLKQSIYLDRYFLFAGLFYSAALVLFLFTVSNRFFRYLLVLILLVVNFGNYLNYWRNNDVAHHPGMGAAAAYLNAAAQPDDKIILGSSFEFFNFKYYNKTKIAPLLYTPGTTHVNQLQHYAGTALLTDQDLLQSWDSNTNVGDVIWVIWTDGFGGRRPDNIPKNWVQTQELSWPDVRPYIGTNIYVDEYLVNKNPQNPFAATSK